MPSHLPVPCSPTLAKAGWKDCPQSLVGNLMDPFRSGQELGSLTHPPLPARCDAETLPGIPPASAGHRVPFVLALCFPIMRMLPSPFPSCSEQLGP